MFIIMCQALLCFPWITVLFLYYFTAKEAAVQSKFWYIQNEIPQSHYNCGCRFFFTNTEKCNLALKF